MIFITLYFEHLHHEMHSGKEEKCQKHCHMSTKLFLNNFRGPPLARRKLNFKMKFVQN
jgi:hypothetical protein